ncbi:uncharacterized protein LOC136081308 [Hydra vulgaris]|uniref:Uncharacterized protein LOC136081308 n=1 Tax=Hydra vulgaris TaxID=6087 RepID=A0ABM4BZL7_HYDVU
MDPSSIRGENKPSTTFDICTFNCQGLKSNIEFTKSLIQSYDITFLCEYWISKLKYSIIRDLFNKTHSIYFHQSNKHVKGRPFVGNAFFIRRNQFQNIRVLYEDDHILAINFEKNELNIIVIGIYLSSSRNSLSSLEEYKSQLDIVKGLINSYEGNGNIIIAGDFQSFPHQIYDLFERSNSKRNSYSVHLSEFLKTNQLELVDVTKGSGPNYTYRHQTLPNSSYIDHVAIPKYTNFLSIKCIVHPECSNNLSDHLPLSISVEVEGKHTKYNTTIEEDTNIPSYAWNDSNFINSYNNHLTNCFNYLNFTDNYEYDLIQIYKTIAGSAQIAFKETLKSKKQCLYSKSWWTPELSRSKTILSIHFNKWRDSGFLKDLNSVTFNRYLMARKSFRKAVKLAQNNKICAQYNKIKKLKNIRPKNFWNAFRCLNKDINSRLFTINNKKDKESITSEFANHFEKVLNTSKITHRNGNHRRIPPCTKHDDVIITEENIIRAISNLKFKKSPDSFGISAEHLKYANCDTLTKWLIKFFNYFINYGWTPLSMSTSIIVPLVKSYKKSLDSPNNYRGISIIPIFTKVLEYLILIICPDIIDTHPLQFGFNANCSTLHAEFLISETIKHYNSNNSPVYLCSLDVEKAFDSCNWNILFDKLYFDKKLPLCIVNTISSLYNNSSATVSYQGCKSNSFLLKQGVRQGSILSPHLYNIYTESLLETITNQGIVGTSIYGNFTGVVAYADDIIVLSSTLSGLKKLIKSCNIYSNLNCIKINAEKTEFLISGKAQIQTNTITISSNKINLQNKLRHLGFTWDTKHSTFASLNNTYVDEKISNFRAVVQTLIQSGIRFAHPGSISYIYKLLAVPTLTYGMEICENNSDLMKKLDVIGRSALKSLLNVSKHSKNYTNLLFKIQEISKSIQQNKLNLFLRLLNNKTTSDIIFSQLKDPLFKHSFVGDIQDLCRFRMLNFQNLIQNKKKIKIALSKSEIPSEVEQTLKHAVECWNAKEQRGISKQILEEKILK